MKNKILHFILSKICFRVSKFQKNILNLIYAFINLKLIHSNI